jgi:putative spermidine/putrescine transport system substrate-binding protein
MFRNLIASAALLAVASGAQAADPTGLLDNSWDEIVAQAKEEGELNWFVWYFQPDYRQLAEEFTAEYGITVNIPEGTHEGNIEKFLAERDRSPGDIDVLAMGSDRVDLFDPNEVALGPLTDVLPNGAQMPTMVGGFDGQAHAFGWWGNQTGVAYDPEKISEDELPQSIDDFAAYFAENPGQFGLNYENGGSGPSFFTHVARNLSGLSDEDFLDGELTEAKMASLQNGWNWFLENTDGYVITASNTDSLQRISQGEFTMVAAWEDHLYGLQKKGEVSDRIRFYIPEFGMTGGGNFNLVPANAPHPAAALVFMNWLNSAEIQTKLNEVFGAAPMHPDADDSKALVPMAMRAHSVISPGNPFNTELRASFVENVALER